MEITTVLTQLDDLLHQCQLEEAGVFLYSAIAEARKTNDTDAEKTLLNEQIGFYRDCGKFPEALRAAAEVRALFESTGETDTIPYATTMLNCANAYRAAGEHEAAFAAYDTVQALYTALLPETDGRVASLWNNRALLYQEIGQWVSACDCLRHALELVRQQGAETRVAISCTNLAVSLLHLQHTEEAFSLLTEADKIFAGCTPSDFHYSATLAGFGDAYYQIGDYAQAASYYERALPEIELHMGQNNFYTIVSENLEQAYQKQGVSRPQPSGLALCRQFYDAFGSPVLERQFKEILPQIAIGLIGEGSECLGFDDILSRDHDFGPGFCIWVPDDFPEETMAQLQRAYDALPKSYLGFCRVTTPEAKGRVGVCRIGAFFTRLLGMPDIPQTETEWLSVEESMLAAACSGALFRDDAGEMTKRQRKLRLGYPKAVRLRRLAQQLGRMAQCGQYNYSRMRQRGDIATAQIYLTQFCLSAMQAAHLCRGVYAPYEKWLLRSTAALPGCKTLAEQIQELLLFPPQTTQEYKKTSDPVHIRIQQICAKIAQEVMMDQHNTPQTDIYLAQTAQELAAQAEKIEQQEAAVERIIQLEWKAFDTVQNIGGRAACQDDWETFSIMRRSQYRSWPTELLQQWIAAFEQATADGRNLITEKYARMMESTYPEAYAKMKSQLPPIAEDFIQLREAIIAIQIPWMEEFAVQYPTLASRARTIHTKDDTPWETSYETYLRGELTAYPFEVLYGYGRWIVQLHQQGKNLSRIILENTIHAYGYATLEEAEKDGCCP